MLTDSSNANQLNVLVAGRAGELTHHANPITFSLLELIFGYSGPYRNTLKKFGVKVNDINESYLVLKDSIVYTDITKEEKILWGNYPFKLDVKDGRVSSGISISIINPIKATNLLMKTIREANIIANLDKYMAIADSLYKNISYKVAEIISSHSIDLKDFLLVYQDTIYITYLYELLDSLNPNLYTKKTDFIKNYIKSNDYLLSSSNEYIENNLKLNNGFYLDDYTNLNEILQSNNAKEFIPDYLPNIELRDNLTKQEAAELKLQCMKNNLRLKSDVLLFFLNMAILRKAKGRIISTMDIASF